MHNNFNDNNGRSCIHVLCKKCIDTLLNTYKIIISLLEDGLSAMFNITFINTNKHFYMHTLFHNYWALIQCHLNFDPNYLTYYERFTIFDRQYFNYTVTTELDAASPANQ